MLLTVVELIISLRTKSKSFVDPSSGKSCMVFSRPLEANSKTKRSVDDIAVDG